MSRGITIVGLGPGDPGLLTVEAAELLRAATEIYLRTQHHPTVTALPPTAVHSFDDAYEAGETFEQVYDYIAGRVVELGEREQGVVYAVPGHPLVGESTVQRVLRLAEERWLPVRIVEGLSFIEPICTRLDIDPLDGLQLGDAMLVARQHYPPFQPDLPILLGQLFSREVASDVKLVLMMVYPDTHPVTLLRAASTRDIDVRTIPLYELDHEITVDHLTSLYVPPLPAPGSLEAFQELVAHLRAPEGCPWDREQTHLTLRTSLLEETYEVLQAMDLEDIASLQEEMGDLLLQVLLNTQIAVEEGEFKMADVVGQIITKLKRRHPHVFGDAVVKDAEAVLTNWEQIKAQERGTSKRSMLASVPAAMPALARAEALQRRAARVGFDWPDVERVWAKVDEEYRELRAAKTPDERRTELGDLLFSAVALSRWLEIDTESALREAVERFARRFGEVERLAAERGQHLADMRLAELESLWEHAKKQQS